MQRRIMTLIAFSLLAVPAAGFSQVRTPPTPRAPATAATAVVPGVEIADQILAHREELGLSEDQVTRIRTLRNQHVETLRPIAEQLRAQRPDAARPDAQRAATMRDRMRQRQDSIRPRADSIRARARTMTDEERQAMRDTMRTRTQRPVPTPRAGVRADAQATPEMRAQMEQLREGNREFVEQINAVLTPAQRQKLSELRPRRGPGGR